MKNLKCRHSGNSKPWRCNIKLKNNRLQDLIEDADKALYLAKKNGRNRVKILESEDVPG